MLAKSVVVNVFAIAALLPLTALAIDTVPIPEKSIKPMPVREWKPIFLPPRCNPLFCDPPSEVSPPVFVRPPYPNPPCKTGMCPPLPFEGPEIDDLEPVSF